MSPPPGEGPSIVLATTHSVHDQRIAHREAASLDALGLQIHLVGKAEGSPPAYRFPTTEVEGSIESANAKLRLAIRVLGEALKLNPTLLHVHDLELLLAVGLRSVRVPVVFDSHENYDLKLVRRLPLPSGWTRVSEQARKLFARAETALIRHTCSGICVVVPRQKDYYGQALKRAGRTPPPPVCLVPNYPTERLFPRSRVRDISMRQRPIDVLHVGSLTPERGLHLLPDVAHRMAANVARPLHVVFVNRTHVSRHSDAVQRVVQETSSVVRWIPSVTHADMAQLLRESKVVLSPLQDTGQNSYVYPTKLFEAWSQGTPVVAGDVGYSGHLVRLSGAGIAVRADDPSAYAESVIALLNDEERWHSQALAGMNFVFDRGYTWEKAALPELLALYRGLG